VAKLFNLVQPHVAVFGKKDAQQVLVIRRMARDLNMPVEIVLAPTVREADGLAMSSRNRYLSAADRQRALALHQGLQAAAVLFVAGERQSSRLTAAVADSVIAAGGSIDYVELVNTVELQPVQDLVGDAAILAVAAFFGGTRLIDNIFLSPETT
jgi:pantoate--beta-alanine ligase